MTITELAKKMGVSRTALYRILEGYDQPTTEDGNSKNKQLTDGAYNYLLEQLQKRPIQKKVTTADTTEHKRTDANDSAELDALRTQVEDLKANLADAQKELAAANATITELRAGHEAYVRMTELMLSKIPTQIEAPNIIQRAKRFIFGGKAY